MTHEEYVDLLGKIGELAEIVAKLNERTKATVEALQMLRKILDLNDQRLINLETFMRRATGSEPNPYVGVPPQD